MSDIGRIRVSRPALPQTQTTVVSRSEPTLPDDLAQDLSEMAWRENRWPKQQAEWLLWQAIEQATQKAQPQEVSCGTE